LPPSDSARACRSEARSRPPCQTRLQLVRRAFFFSLLVHVSLLLWTFRASPPPAEKPLPVELWPATGGAGAKGTGRGRGGAKAAHLRMKDLLAPFGPGSSGSAGGGNGGKGRGGSGGRDLDTMTVARGMRFEEEVARRPWLDAVWTALDSAVDYPEDFVYRRIAGTVRVQVELDGQGRLVGGFGRVTASQKYLRAYVLAALARGLKESIPKAAWRETGMALALHFEFGTSAEPGAVDRNRGGVLRNQLSFVRLAYAKPEWEEAVERVFTKIIPPIVVFPGGFYVDFVRLYRMIDSWGKPDEADIRADRIQQMYELLQSRAHQPPLQP